MMRRSGHAGSSLAIGNDFVIVRHGYTENSSGDDTVDYAVVIVYHDSTSEQRKADRRYRIHNDRVQLTVGKTRLEDIRGTDKLYVIRGEELQVLDSPCSPVLIDSLTHPRPNHVDSIEAYIGGAVEAARTARPERDEPAR